jgi:hypothetical protein
MLKHDTGGANVRSAVPGYEAVGYTIILPASAIPGWPADVTLAADPLWKRDYSISQIHVRRLQALRPALAAMKDRNDL